MFWCRSGTAAGNTKNTSAPAFLGPDYDPMCIPDPSKKNFEVTDLESAAKSASQRGGGKPSGVSEAWWTGAYRKLNEGAEHANMDALHGAGLR